MAEGENSRSALEPAKGKLIVVVLVGAPGSGKTTFCNDVMSAARRPWARICQDTIANGKAGTKVQCLKSAADALKNGTNVFIDRCNLEHEQRVDFVKLGGSQVDVHAVVLDLPARLCISRSVKRTGHEGNLQGGKAAAVVNRMLQKKEPPKLSEGFSRITFCQNEKDVKDAVDTYIALGPSDSLPVGDFGHKSTDAKVQLGIMKFLKKVEVPKNAESDGSQSRVSALKQENEGNDPCAMELEEENEDAKTKREEDLSGRGDIVGSSKGDIHTLAFPSISTSDFQFNHEKASDVIVDVVADFLNKVDNIRLVLVDLSPKSDILSLVRTKAAKKQIDSNKFSTFVGDITQLWTGGGLRCHAIANAANWRLKPGGGGVNAAIFKAAGEALEIATKQRAETIRPGCSVVVRLPSTSQLYQKEGVSHVIHVLGPNMNPLRPDCLNNDYVRGCKVLRDAYSSLFVSFASIPCSQLHQKERGSFNRLGNSDTRHGLVNDTVLSDQKTKRDHSHENGRNKKSKGLTSELHPKDEQDMQFDDPGSLKSKTTNSNAGDDVKMGEDKVQKHGKVVTAGAKSSWGSWAQALHQIAMHPEKHKDALLELSDGFVVLNDLYPKAKHHILVLSRANGLDSLADVRREHLPLLKEIHSAGLRWAEKFFTDDDSLIFRLGYHSVPSMRQLHLHVISQDFRSAHLKNKKHWNSFNTAFFRDSSDVIEEIEKYGVANINDEARLLSMELRCHRCWSAHPNIPRLKSHVAACKISFPSSLLQNGRLVFASCKAASAT